MKDRIAQFIPFSQHRQVRQFYKFTIVGVSNTLIDFAIYLLLTRFVSFFSTYFLFANVISFSIAVSNSFVWNRKWTFRSTDAERAKQYGKFFLVNIGGLIINTALLSLFVYQFGMHDVLSKILAVGVSTAWNFFINRWWVFRDEKLAKTP